jgi:hypothetical protein
MGAIQPSLHGSAGDVTYVARAWRPASSGADGEI